MRKEVENIAREISKTGTIHDPAHGRLLETRKAVVTGWVGIAATLDAQGEIVLAADVSYFANHLSPVLTDRERLAEEFVRHLKKPISPQTESRDLVRDRALERSR